MYARVHRMTAPETSMWVFESCLESSTNQFQALNSLFQSFKSIITQFLAQFVICKRLCKNKQHIHK